MLSPILEIEDQVQIKDQTRFSATKSFKTKDETDFTICTVQPGMGGPTLDIFDPLDQKNWFADWFWPDAQFDIDAALHRLYFLDKSTGLEYEVPLATGTYSFAALVAQMQTALNGASPLVWSLTLSSKNKIVMTVSNAVEIQYNKNPDTNLWPLVGFPYKTAGLNFLGEVIEAGLRQITVEVATATTSQSEIYWQKVFTPQGDGLFSRDQDLKIHEPNIMDWVRDGRASFLDMHRRSQEQILDWIYQAGYTDKNNRRLTKFDILDLEDVKLWSVFETLQFLCMSFQNSVDDIWQKKAGQYEKLKFAARQQASLKLDYNKNGEVDPEERVNISSGTLLRR